MESMHHSVIGEIKNCTSFLVASRLEFSLEWLDRPETSKTETKNGIRFSQSILAANLCVCRSNTLWGAFPFGFGDNRRALRFVTQSHKQKNDISLVLSSIRYISFHSQQLSNESPQWIIPKTTPLSHCHFLRMTFLAPTWAIRYPSRVPFRLLPKLLPWAQSVTSPNKTEPNHWCRVHAKPLMGLPPAQFWRATRLSPTFNHSISKPRNIFLRVLH